MLSFLHSRRFILTSVLIAFLSIIYYQYFLPSSSSTETVDKIAQAFREQLYILPSWQFLPLGALVGKWLAVVLNGMSGFSRKEDLRKYSEFLFEGSHKNISLSQIEFITEGKFENVKGAEAFVEDDQGSLYTGLWDGRIIKILPNSDVEVVARLGSNSHLHCRSFFSIDNNSSSSLSSSFPSNSTSTIASHIDCSRPLGLVFSPTSSSTLFVADAWKGLLSVDLSTSIPNDQKVIGDFSEDVSIGAVGGKSRVEKSLSRSAMSDNVRILSDRSSDGKRILSADGVDVDREGRFIYFTSLGLTYGLDLYTLSIFEDPYTGCLYRYDTKSGITDVILSNLLLANGLARSHDGESLLIILTGGKVLRYYIDGKRKGSVEVFLDERGISLDNIRRHPKRPTYILAGDVFLTQSLRSVQRNKTVRKILRSILPLWIHKIIVLLTPSKWGVIECDENGKIVNSVGDSELGVNVFSVSDGYVSPNGDLYIGSFSPEQHLMRLKGKDIHGLA